MPPPFSASWTWKSYLRQSFELAAIMLASLGGYLLVLKWRGHEARYTTWIAADEWFPFWPGWVWAYLLPYLIGPAVIGFLHRSTFKWFVQRGLVVVGLTLLIFILVPTQTAPRPTEHGLTGLTGWIYTEMVKIDDPPANAAPSLHVSVTCLLALALLKDFPRWWPVTVLAVALVWLATLLTRQHHLIDVFTGAGLALAVAGLWRQNSHKEAQKAQKEEPRF
jgi:hypothetical protein